MILNHIRVTLSITIYPAVEGFVEAEAGYRFHAAGQPGEWRIDLTMGLRPWPQDLFALQLSTRHRFYTNLLG
jgi:hypothetical protein